MNAATAAAPPAGADSTPLATFTIQGRTRATRSATLRGVRPPARISRGRGGPAIQNGLGHRGAGPARLAGDKGIHQDRIQRPA